MPRESSLHSTLRRSIAERSVARSGIGLAAAIKYAKAGMSVFLVDITEPALTTAVERVKVIEGVSEVMGMKVDVSKVDEVVALRERVLDVFGEVGLPQPAH